MFGIVGGFHPIWNGTSFIAVNVALLILSNIFGVVGIETLIHHYRKPRVGILKKLRISKDDFHNFYFPIWKRMFFWFLSAGAAGVITTTIVRAFQ